MKSNDRNIFQSATMGTKLLANNGSSQGVADKLPKEIARLHIFTRTTQLCCSPFCLSVHEGLTQNPQTQQNTKHCAISVKTAINTARLEPTIKSGDPEDLCEVHSDDVEATGSPLRQETDHHLQKLLKEGWRLVLLSEQ